MDQPALAPDPKSVFRSKERIVWIWPLAILLIVLLAMSIILIIREIRNDRELTNTDPSIAFTEQGPQPATITVRKGQAVTWVNQDKRPHALVGDQDAVAELDSEETLATNESYSFVFEKTGTYSYHDPANPAASRGTVIVE